MLEGARIVVIVPALDEEPRIGRVVASMPSFVDEVIVVDDGSADDTRGAALASGEARRVAVQVVRHDRNRGVGAAIASGYARALATDGSPVDAFCVMAGDGQMAPEDLARVALPVVRGEADYAKGDRLSRAASRARMPLARRLGGLGFSWLTSRAIGRPVHDSQCGFTALSRRAAGVLDLAGLWPRYGYPNDLLGQLVARDRSFVEVPVEAIYAGEPSKLRLWHLPRIAWLVGRAYVRRIGKKSIVNEEFSETGPTSQNPSVPPEKDGPPLAPPPAGLHA